MSRLVGLILLLLFMSCGHPKPRKPIMSTGSMDMSKSVELNKQLYNQEIAYFKTLMQQDSTHTYIDSKHGFWYTYLTERSTDSIFPDKGDEVVFSYDIKDIYGHQIYSQEELGNKTYRVDQEDFMQGIQEGIKLMQVDEKLLFLLPSLKAYGVYGDGNKITTHTPLLVTVELINIQ